MSKYHDHRSDCPFKFAPLDVCDCAEHNMLDHIEQLVAANKSMIKELKTCRMAQVVMENGIAEVERERDDYAFKLADANNTYSEMHVALEEANDKLATCEKYRDAYAECDRIGTQAVRDLEAKLAKAVVALRKLHHAVCGETGFAACVRLDSGLAYPWPALDEADEMTRATLAEIEGEKG